jgi:NodT family efflux transporter outer membrane factor (OMF) lipoprotein
MTTTPRPFSGGYPAISPRRARGGGGVRVPFAVAMLATLASCAVDTPLPNLHQDLPSQWRGPVEGALPAPDLEHWWQAFASPELDRLMQIALHENLSIAQARERLRAARALQHRAATEFRPRLSFSTSSITDPSGSTGYYEIGFDAAWELPWFGRGEGSARTAAGERVAAEADLAAVRVSVIAEVARNYVELRAAQTRTAVFDEIVALHRRRAELLATRERLRLSAPAERAMAEGELATAQAEAEEAPSTAATAANALAVLLATTIPDATLSSPAPQPQAPSTALPWVPADLVRTRPEIRRAEAAVLRAAGELGQARADLYPKLALAGSLTSATRITGDIDRPNKAIPILGPLIDLPILDWGARRDLIDARQAALAAAVLGYRQAVLEGIAETESALAQFAHQQRRVSTATAALAAAERGASAARTLRDTGLADELDVTSAQLAVCKARLDLALAVRDAALAFIALYKSLGGQLPPELAAR